MKSVELNRTCTRFVLALFPEDPHQLQTNAQNYSQNNIIGILKFVLDSPGYRLLELCHSPVMFTFFVEFGSHM